MRRLGLTKVPEAPRAGGGPGLTPDGVCTQAWGAATRAGGACVRVSAFGAVFPVLSPVWLQLGPCLISLTMASALEEVRVRPHFPHSAVRGSEHRRPALAPAPPALFPELRCPAAAFLAPFCVVQSPSLASAAQPPTCSGLCRLRASVAPGKLPMETRRSAPALPVVPAGWVLGAVWRFLACR